MKRFLLSLWILCCLAGCGSDSSAAVLVQSANGAYSSAYTTLSAAATSPGVKLVVVTSALSAVQSNISSATLHAWPSDRALKIEKGGSIGNTTTFRVASVEAGDYQVFAGTGTVEGLGDARLAWFGLAGDGTTDDSAALLRAYGAVSIGGGTLDGGGKTYLLNTSGIEVDTDNVFIRNATFKRTSTVNGFLVWYAKNATTVGGGLENVHFIGNPEVAAGNGGLCMGSSAYKANAYVLDGVTADSFSQYGVGIEAGDNWKISNIRVTNHGLTTGAIASCIGFYVYPKIASSGGQLNNIYAEISAASQANASANHAAVKIQTHGNLTGSGFIAIGGSEEAVSIDSFSGRVTNLIITPQANNAGLAVGNQNKSHDFSGRPFEIDGVMINGTSTNALSISGSLPVAITAVDTTADTLTSAAHGLPVNTPVAYTTDGLQAGGLIKERLYYVVNPTADTLQLSLTLGGAAIDLTGAGSGTQQIQTVRLSNCAIRNVRGEKATVLNYAAFKNCEFSNWDFSTISLDPTVAGVVSAACDNTGNVLRGIKARPSVVGNRFAIKTSDSNVDGCGVMSTPGATIGTLPQIVGQRNKVKNLLGGYITGYSDLASLSDGAGASVTLSGTATSGVAFGDLLIGATSQSLAGGLLSTHMSSATAVIMRVQNESGVALDLDNTRFAARKVRPEEMSRIGVKASHQFSASNLADGAGVATTVTVPGVALGDIAIAAWKSTVASNLISAYVSAADTITVRIQNETAGASSAVTAVADLNVCTLRESAADFVNAATYDPPSLADGAGVTTTVAVPGASPGDFVAASFSLDLQGVLLSVEVSSVGVASVRFQNETGAPVDLALGSLKVLVFAAN